MDAGGCFRSLKAAVRRLPTDNVLSDHGFFRLVEHYLREYSAGGDQFTRCGWGADAAGQQAVLEKLDEREPAGAEHGAGDQPL